LTANGGNYMTVYCRSSNGTANGGCLINGWTTGASNYIEMIQVDFPANGIYDATKFRVTGTNVNLIETYEDYLRFHHLQFEVTATNAGNARGLQCPSMGVENYILVDSCIFKGVCSGTGLGIGFQSGDADVIVDVVNCVAYGFYIAGDTNFSGINVAGTGHIYNCTVHSCTQGITGVAGTSVYNCASFNNEDDFAGTIGTIDHCASDDGDGTNAQDFTAEATDWNKVFTDYANGDVTLKNYTTSPCCVGVGVDAPGGALYSDDIIGTARSTTWDIGAFEYFVTGATLTAETGSYVLTGTAVTLLKSNLLTIGVGNYILTGQAASFLKSSLITVDAGSYTLTGQVVTLLRSSLVEAGVGSYVLTGQDVTLTKVAANDFSKDTNCKLLWRFESEALTVDSIGDNTLTNVGVDEDTDDYREGGCSARFVRANADRMYILDEDLDSGVPLKGGESNRTFSIPLWYKPLDTAVAVDLIFKGISPYRCFRIKVDMDGKVIFYLSPDGLNYNSLQHDSVLSEDEWYHITVTYDNANGDTWIRIRDAACQTVGADKNGTLASPYISPGYVMLGFPTDVYGTEGKLDELVLFDDVLSVAESDRICAGTYSAATYTLTAEAGSYVLTGQAAGLLKSNLIVIGAGSYVITGTAVSLFKGRLLTIEPGSCVLTGMAVSLLKSNLLSMGAGSYTVTGQAVTLTYTPVSEYVLTAGVGSYVVIGKAAVLRYIAEAAEIPPLMHKDLIDLYSGGAWLWLCEISIPGYAAVPLARNRKDVIYGGKTFDKHNFDIGQQSFSGDGSVPQIQLRIAQDPDRTLEDKVNATQGACGGSVKLIRASEKFLDTAVEELEHTFDILTAGSDTEWVTFVLGIPNPLTRRIPLRLYSSKVCPYATPSLFKGPECQYDEEDETCTGLLEDCFEKGNAHHWGGEAGLDPNTVRI